MVKKNKSLAEYLYDNLQQNHYLRKLVKQLFTQYAYFLFQAKWSLDKKEKTDLLKFADLLSKAQSNNGTSECKNLALKIITMLQKMYPEDPNVDIVRNTVLSSLKNYLPRENHGYIKINTVDFLWDEVIDNYNKIQRKIPGQENQTFIGDQDKIFNSLENSINSFSAPTSMGKTYLMKKFIEYKVKTGEELNFAITVPSKALITEVRSSLLTDLVDNLNEHSYRIISRAEEYALDYENRNYIFVMTPERLSNLLLDNDDLRLDYLFIDESQKATEMDDRSIYYYEIIDKVQKWKQKPRITFASPLIPNPDVFLQLIDGSIKNNIRVDESPVTQTKFIIDRYNKELSVYNDQTKKKQHLCEFTENAIPHIVKMITDVMKGKTQSLIYYGSKRDVMSDTIVFSRQLPTIESKELDELAAYISRKINPKYVLVDLVKKGIAFHIGELPIDVRTKIEEAYRKGILRTVFCTSTLLEGVNLPADNIFVTSLGNGKKKLSQLEFLNLIGRVGRLGHSMIGNVFLITGEKDKSHSNLSSYLKYLSKKLSKEHLSVEKALKPKQVAAIKKSLSAGDLKLSAVTDKRNYDLLRKISLIYIKELNHNQEGFTRKQFKKKISDDDETEIFTALHSRYPDELQDDVNFSADQSNLLTRAISDEQIKGFPQIFNDENKLNVEETYQFFLKLAHIFNWNLYERKFVHADSDENIQHQTLEDYAKLTLMWISGYSLKQICDYVIAIRERLDFQFLDRLDQSRKLVGNINWDTIAINITMNQLNKLNFVLGKYFLKVSKELSANSIPLDNNWYQYLEYGTSSDLRIWLQQNGYSRESSQYIEDKADELIINSPFGPLISNRIDDANDPDVINETKEIKVNVPEIFD